LPMKQNGFVQACRGAMFGASETSSATRERIDLATIRKTVIEDLPALKAAVEHALNRPSEG
jgi:hypothetical protein